jgi:hypothetical protein
MNKKSNTDELILNIIEKIDKAQRKNINPIRKIAIFSTPRSGSTYFCDLLSQTKIIGEPREWFNERFIRAYGRYFNKENIKLWRYTSEGIFVKIDNTDINTNINDSKEMNLITAKVLIAATDWSVLPDVTLTETSKNNFIIYREFLRNIIINPIEGHIVWPPVPVAEWTTL